MFSRSSGAVGAGVARQRCRGEDGHGEDRRGRLPEASRRHPLPSAPSRCARRGTRAPIRAARSRRTSWRHRRRVAARSDPRPGGDWPGTAGSSPRTSAGTRSCSSPGRRDPRGAARSSPSASPVWPVPRRCPRPPTSRVWCR